MITCLEKVYKKRKVKCPNCNNMLLELEHGEKPFRPNALELLICVKCSRCQKEVKIMLNNSQN